jgi:hypothetical protein
MDCRFSPLAPRVLVSEYQYYDFRAIDRLLTKKEMGSLRSISTRAAITTTRFTNHYEWEDLNANRSKLELSLGQHALQFHFLFSGVLRNHARTAAGQMRGGAVGEEAKTYCLHCSDERWGRQTSFCQAHLLCSSQASCVYRRVRAAPCPVLSPSV